jgi:unsaturated rhamnogalacturonyl hydrolase
MNDSLSTALAETILSRYPDPIDIPYRRWCYVQGYVLAGFEKLWRATGEQRYLDYVMRFAEAHVTADGQAPAFTGESLDDIMAGTILVAAYQHTGARRFRVAADRVRAVFDDYPRNADGGFWHSRSLPHEMWIDGVFMGQMFLTRYGAVIGDAGYCFGEAARQITCLAGHCRKASSGLYRHAYDEARRAAWADPLTGLSPEVWSEGLGWYALILVETLDQMPSGGPEREPVLAILRDLLAELRRAQDPLSGRWYQVVDRGERADNWHDTSGSAMFVYAIRRAVDLGYADAEEYLPVAERGYAGIAAQARANEAGQIDIYEACDGVCVQRSYADYVNYPRVVNAKEAVGGFLWAATAMAER